MRGRQTISPGAASQRISVDQELIGWTARLIAPDGELSRWGSSRILPVRRSRRWANAQGPIQLTLGATEIGSYRPNGGLLFSES